MKLTVVISAFNEEDKIRDCLESVRGIADEIIFIDNSSTDKTSQIAKEYTSKIFTRFNNPMLNINKNFGFTKAGGDWILSLDADERVTQELAKEVQLAISNSPRGPLRLSEASEAGKQQAINGYYIPRKNIIFGKWMRHTGWYPDYQLRLFKKGKGRFPEKHVHEAIEIEGKADYLKEHLTHYNYETISQFLRKLMNIYGPNEAEQLLEKGYRFNWKDAIGMPSKEFLSRFFAQEGYKDGLHGLILSFLMAFYHLVVLVYIWEKQGFKEVEVENLLGEVEKEFRKEQKEIRFWFFNEQAKQTKSKFKKFLLKMRYRLN